jgi:hypothetical protein
LGLKAQTFIEAPAPLTGSAFRLPNGTAAYSFTRGAYLIRGSELASLPSGTSVSKLGFKVSTAGVPAASPVSGTIKIYMGNTTNTTYSLGGTFSTIISGLTLVYNGPFTIPGAVGNVDLTLNTPFAYTGAGVHVAYDFEIAPGSTPLTTGVTWASNSTSFSAGLIMEASATAAPASLTQTSSFRPTTRFGYNNTLTNDASVLSGFCYGKLAADLVGSDMNIVSASIKNNGINPITNVKVRMTVSGANTYTAVDSIPLINPGDTASVSFGGFIPTNLGLSNIKIKVGPDQNTANDSIFLRQTLTCNFVNVADTNVVGGSVGFNTGRGILSNLYQMTFRPSKVRSARIAIAGNTSVGQKVRAVVINSQEQIIAKSALITIVTGDINTVKLFNFPKPPVIEADSFYFVGLEQTQGATPVGYFPLGYQSGTTGVFHFSHDTLGGLTGFSTSLGRWIIEPQLEQVTILSSVDSVCNNGPVVNLTGFPSGGTFSGIGVSASTFNPSLGTVSTNNTITYSVAPLASGCSNTGTTNIFVKNCFLSLTDLNNTSDFSVSPNPSNGVFTLTSTNYDIEAFKVLDILGKTIIAQSYNNATNETIDLSKYPSGVYFLQVSQAGKTKTTKLTKN